MLKAGLACAALRAAAVASSYRPRWKFANDAAQKAEERQGSMGLSRRPRSAHSIAGSASPSHASLTVRDRGLRMADGRRPVFFMQPGADEKRMIALRGIGMRQRVGWIECKRP